MEQERLHSPSGQGALMICGDLNATPETAPIELLLRGKVSAKHPFWIKGKEFRWRKKKNRMATTSSLMSEVDLPDSLKEEVKTKKGQIEGNEAITWVDEAIEELELEHLSDKKDGEQTLENGDISFPCDRCVQNIDIVRR